MQKLRIAVVGLGGRGKENLGGAFRENVVAVCDVDTGPLQAAVARCAPDTPAFTDFRRLLDAMDGRLDAVMVNTPDHSHFTITMAALERGLHVYCEKPLAHSVRECRLLAQEAAARGLVTQMGNQMHTAANYRHVVEQIRAGALGQVREVHVWCGKGWGGIDAKLPGADRVPSTLDWGLWLTGAPERPYRDRMYHPANWRRWWDFGSGTLGDMGCHYMDLVFWALGLNAPVRVSATGPDLETQREMAPLGLRVAYDFRVPGRSEPLRVTWYDGDAQPGVFAEYALPHWPGGVLFVGEDGLLMADYTRRALRGGRVVSDVVPIPDSAGHFADFFHAIRTGTQAPCDFSYTGPLTECILLGVVAYRSGVSLEWDSANLRVLNSPDAQRLVEG